MPVWAKRSTTIVQWNIVTMSLTRVTLRYLYDAGEVPEGTSKVTDPFKLPADTNPQYAYFVWHRILCA